MDAVLLAKLNNSLPQTQCQQCGYDGCLPYAQAMLEGAAPINLCPPGGDVGVRGLAEILDVPVLPFTSDMAAKAARPKTLAVIREADCIGCTACIKACPVDAILGANKRMHTVIAKECTGCELCVAPCPVDCIDMLPVSSPFLPLGGAVLQEEAFAQPRVAAAHARSRYEVRSLRLLRNKAAREAFLQAKQAQLKAKLALTQAPMVAEPDVTVLKMASPSDIIAAAMARAKARLSENQQTDAQKAAEAAYRQEQLETATNDAEIRNAQRDIKYGSETERQQAIALLRDKKRAARAKKKA
ncbi:MAG: RnfABCDGE type electron transport complex subunit B [Neisseriaceae bacterium]|nr:RnfABCDGE type electron transport complex subunit B [Neisseriaceae bacterium]MBP6863443.1 RnfABCDGE type electron transport complex subunit B [Neisseriaceae bacterium]